MKWILRILPWGFLALFVTEIVAVMLPKPDGEFHVREFGRLPVLLNGRVQPFDSVARNSLLQIRSTGDVPLEEVPSWKFWHHPTKLKATQWLLEVMARPELADTRPIFLIHHAELLGELKLQDKGVEKSGLRYYTFNQLEPVIKEIDAQGQKANAIKPEEQTSFQKQVGKLANAVALYQRLKLTLEPEGTHDFNKDLDGFLQALGPARAAAQATDKGTNFDQEAIARVAGPLREFQVMAEYALPLVVPPANPAEGRDRWQNAGASLLDSSRTGEIHPAMKLLAAMATAYHQEQAATFNQALAAYQDWLKPNFQKELRKGRAEFYFNDMKPFLHAMIIYIFALLLAGGAFATFTLLPALSETLRRSSFYLILLAGVVHTFGLVFRMVLEGRPPVTNLYSSAIFIGWGTLVLGIILERMYRVGIGNLLASVAGFVTLIIAHNLALGGDTMEMLRAVLDTNFWLATHVVVVTLGYAATFAAGLVAIVYVLLGLCTPILALPLANAAAGTQAPGPYRSAARSSRSSSTSGRPISGAMGASANTVSIGKALSKMVYGIVCFATLFSFVGTVLGGIWADQSWGRFWGWDPKENGALLIVLWNAIILHARWGGLVKDRGIMNLAIFGNIVTSFSWFGVNMLGIGLHSYGFMEAGFRWLTIFIGLQLFFIALGLTPLNFWRSFRSQSEPPATLGRGAPKTAPAVT